MKDKRKTHYYSYVTNKNAQVNEWCYGAPDKEKIFSTSGH